MEETIVSTRKVYSGRIVKLDVHEVRLPNGEHSMREQIRHPGAVAVVPLDTDRNVMMVRQYRLPAQQITLEIPAGTFQHDNEDAETPEDCAVRELQEEIGYKPGRLESLGGFFTAPGYTTEYIHLFMATDLIPSKIAGDVDEFLEVTRLPLADAVRAIESGQIVDGKTIIALFKVARRMGI